MSVARESNILDSKQQSRSFHDTNSGRSVCISAKEYPHKDHEQVQRWGECELFHRRAFLTTVKRNVIRCKHAYLLCQSLACRGRAVAPHLVTLVQTDHKKIINTRLRSTTARGTDSRHERGIDPAPWPMEALYASCLEPRLYSRGPTARNVEQDVQSKGSGACSMESA